MKYTKFIPIAIGTTIFVAVVFAACNKKNSVSADKPLVTGYWLGKETILGFSTALAATFRNDYSVRILYMEMAATTSDTAKAYGKYESTYTLSGDTVRWNISGTQYTGRINTGRISGASVADLAGSKVDGSFDLTKQ